jgi:hypothetical protein
MTAIKTVGSSGQISLGKEFAGRHVMIDQIEPGVWLLKIGSFIPDSERWLHEPQVESAVNEAVAWAEATQPRETDPDDLAKRLDEP